MRYSTRRWVNFSQEKSIASNNYFRGNKKKKVVD